MKRLAAITLLTLVATTGAASADLSSVFREAAAECFDRVYTRQHLRENPRQRVASIRLGYSAQPGSLRAGGQVEALLTIRLIDGQEAEKPIYCSDRGGVVCGLESDGGEITLARSGDRLTIRTRDGMRFETETGSSICRKATMRPSSCRARRRPLAVNRRQKLSRSQVPTRPI